MPESKSILRAGEHLKELRLRLGMTTRDVADLSQRIVDSEGNEEFHISNAWLTEIENSESITSIYKLYSLSVVYHVKFADLLQLFGVDVQKINKLQIEIPLPQTHLTSVEVFDQTGTVTFPIRFDQGFDKGKTNLLSRMVEIWGEVPIGVIQHLDVRHSMYGYVGLEDRTLYPLLRPGSFVQIDASIKKVLPLQWDCHSVRLKLFPNSNKLGRCRAVRISIKLKLLDKLLHRAKNQSPKHVTMAARNSPSSNALSEPQSETFMVVLTRIVVAHRS